MTEIGQKWTILEVSAKKLLKIKINTTLYHTEILHAIDISQAKDILNDVPKIAVILLNIKLGEEVAGLKFIRFIRNRLHKQDVRIILKTNFQNPDLDKDIIQNYEVDGYFPKGSSSKGRLEVAIIAAIRAYKQIVTTHQLLKSMAGSIAHEVRNPLNAISLTSSQIEQSIEDLPKNNSTKKELEKLSSIANTSINRANQIINITLKSLRNEEIDERNFTTISANSAIDKALEEYAFSDENEKSKTTFHKKDSNDFAFKGNETPFIYIIFNIIKNALHYFKQYPDSTITISSKKAGPQDHYNKIIIEDTGPGIEESKLEEIFQSFATSGKEGGTGLGLSFCKRAMGSFKGKIACESEFGKYSRFILSFPVLTDQTISNTNSDNFAKNKILIVDDQEVNLHITKNIIERQLDNVTCYTAKDGKEAIAAFKKEHHDLIFMDIQMPVMNGYEATKKIKNIDKDVPVIAYTSLESKEAQKKANQAGIDHYITKPISHNILIRTIDKWLMNKYSFSVAEENIKKILTGKKVILADDQQINNILLSRMLKKKFDMDIDTVESGEQLIEAFKKQIKHNTPYDIILTDIHMEPGMSGVNASIQIRDFEIQQKLNYKTPIIAITGDDEKHLIHRFFRSGIDDYKKKGATDHALLENIMAFWVNERSHKKIQNNLLTTKIAPNPQDKDQNECHYYDNDYDKINLLNDRVSEDELKEITPLFITSGSNLVEKIKKCQHTNDLQAFKVHVHSLKGISGNMGMERLYRFSHNLHEASKEIDVITDECMRKLDTVFSQTKEVLINLKNK